MDTINSLLGSQDSGSIFTTGLDRASLQQLAPAAFATSPHERMSAKYAFLPTTEIIEKMDEAGFVVIQARQSKPRKKDPAFAPHALRFRQRKSQVFVGEVVPEILVLNSHDGSSGYHVLIALYRAVCTNGMIVSEGAFPSWRVAHRGAAASEVSEAALQLTRRFDDVGEVIERMRGTELVESRCLDFARYALSLRYPNEPVGVAVAPAQLLVPRRDEDAGNDVWHVFNRVQEHIIAGGVSRRTATNRIVRTRGVRAIREDVRLNAGLWERAMAEVA